MRVRRLRFDLEVELGSEPHGAQEAQRIVVQGLLGDQPNDAPLEVCAPPSGSITSACLAAGERPERRCHRVDREVARREVGARCCRAAGSRRSCGRGLRRGSRALYRADRQGERSERAARPRSSGERGSIAVECEVNVGDRPADQPVADGSADEEAGVALQRVRQQSSSRWRSAGSSESVMEVMRRARWRRRLPSWFRRVGSSVGLPRPPALLSRSAGALRPAHRGFRDSRCIACR